MFYITDSLDLDALQDASTYLVTNLPALQKSMEDKDTHVQSRVIQSVNAKILSKMLGIEVKTSKKALKKDELQKGDIVLLLLTKQYQDKTSAFLILAFI